MPATAPITNSASAVGTGSGRVALLGNPNTGKTTLFNALCGSRAKTANFPGTTTSLRSGHWEVEGRRLDVIDLPGVYDLRYHAPETPGARLLASPAILEPMKDRLRAVLATLDPLRLLDEIRTVQHHLAGLASGEPVHVLPHRDADLDRFLRSLVSAWKEGDVRPTHRTGPKPPRHWRTRQDPFEAVWSRVVNWLESEPDRTAKELFDRLQTDQPDFSAGQLRTLQRRVKEWRRMAARRLVFAEPLHALST